MVGVSTVERAPSIALCSSSGLEFHLHRCSLLDMNEFKLDTLVVLRGSLTRERSRTSRHGHLICIGVFVEILDKEDSGQLARGHSVMIARQPRWAGVQV